MPNPDGTLTAQEKQKINAWLTQFDRPAAICPICGGQQWTIGDHIVQPVTLEGGRNMNLFGAGLAYPVVMVVSVPCGYTMYINAVMAGLVRASEEKTDGQ